MADVDAAGSGIPGGALAPFGVYATAFEGRPALRLDYRHKPPRRPQRIVGLLLAQAPDGGVVGRSFLARTRGELDAAFDAAGIGASGGRRSPRKDTALVLSTLALGVPSGVGVPGDGENAAPAAAFVQACRDRIDAALAASGLPRLAADAVAALRAWPQPPPPDLAELLAEAGPRGEAARAYCLEAPLLAAAQWPSERDDGGAGFGRGGEPAMAAGTRRRLARLRPTAFADPQTDVDIDGLVRLAAATPADWLPGPGDLAPSRAMHAVALLAAPFAEIGLAPASLARSCRGDWPGFLARCRAAVDRLPQFDAPLSLPNAVMIVRNLAEDPARSLARTLLLPLAARAGGAADVHGSLDALVPAAARILYGDRALPACIEAALDWHAHQHEIESALPSAWDGRAWKAVHPEMAAGDLRIVPLVTARDLAEEGSPRPDGRGVPGLGHCVGGVAYREAGALGQSHFVSVRRALPGGGYERLATAEARIHDGRLVLVQLQGPGNAPAPRRVEAAVARWLARPVPDPGSFQVPGDAVPAWDTLQGATGYDPLAEGTVEAAFAAWRPFLPRELRGLGPGGLAEAAGIAGAAATPAP